MNAFSPETIQAEQLVRKVWGDIFSRVYLLVEGKTPRDLQDKCDRLALMLLEGEIVPGDAVRLDVDAASGELVFGK